MLMHINMSVNMFIYIHKQYKKVKKLPLLQPQRSCVFRHPFLNSVVMRLKICFFCLRGVDMFQAGVLGTKASEFVVVASHCQRFIPTTGPLLSGGVTMPPAWREEQENAVTGDRRLRLQKPAHTLRQALSGY